VLAGYRLEHRREPRVELAGLEVGHAIGVERHALAVQQGVGVVRGAPGRSLLGRDRGELAGRVRGRRRLLGRASAGEADVGQGGRSRHAAVVVHTRQHLLDLLGNPVQVGTRSREKS
jgi:hypothetical protein